MVRARAYFPSRRALIKQTVPVLTTCTTKGIINSPTSNIAVIKADSFRATMQRETLAALPLVGFVPEN